MRLWSLHPRLLDAKGLVALWREGLLAQAVLRGRTQGYRFHPQLERFSAHAAPKKAIARYLAAVLDEADARGYAFDRRKVGNFSGREGKIAVTDGQLRYEFARLKSKLRRRDPARLKALAGVKPKPHPLFRVRKGGVETWERASA